MTDEYRAVNARLTDMTMSTTVNAGTREQLETIVDNHTANGFATIKRDTGRSGDVITFIDVVVAKGEERVLISWKK